MKRKSFLIIFSILLAACFVSGPKTSLALEQTEKEKLLQQIEILQQEVLLLQTLISNMQLNQEIQAQSYFAVDLSDNSSLLEKNSSQPYPMASVTKLMAAVVALENIDKSQTITLTEEMLKPLGCSPSLFLGLNVSAENLLKAGLIQSTNDAVESLAYFLGKQKFLSLINQKAKDLGMVNTIYYDVHGLNPANRSTAQDLVKLLAYIHKNHPEILAVTKDNNFWLPDSTGKLLKFKNLNNFYPLPEFIGGKTGYLIEAKQTLAAIFSIEGKPIAVVILYSPNRQADVFAILRKISD